MKYMPKFTIHRRTFSHEELRRLEDAVNRAKQIASVTTFGYSDQSERFKETMRESIRYKIHLLAVALKITEKETLIPFEELSVRYGGHT